MNDLIILGVSTRAAAYSACRAGFRPWCVDRFADRDLQAVAPVHRVAEYSHGIPLILSHTPADAPVIYTGSLENHPDVYLALARERRVWGYLHPEPISGDSVRNPFYLQTVCDHAGIVRPALRSTSDTLPTDGPWLVKPLRGAGGRRVARWHGQLLDKPSDYCFQERVAGDSLSVTYVIDLEGARCLGMTRQLVGETFLHAPSAFAYRGNISMDPTSLPRNTLQQFQTLAAALHRADPYPRGLVGVDVIMCDDRLSLIEVNPRYTASVEVLEYATGRALLRDHAAAFGTAFTVSLTTSGGGVIGKGIYYAPFRFRFPATPCFVRAAIDPWSLQTFADLPEAGAVMEQGDPVLSILTRNQPGDLTLREIASELDELFDACR